MASAASAGTQARVPGGISSDVYRGATVVFGTQHGKEAQVAPAFLTILGATVVAPTVLDTDQFGTFTGDVPRKLSPLDSARAKARLAMASTGGSLALASEASYGSLMGMGWAGHEEILVFVDDGRGIEIVEGYRTLGTPGRVLRAAAYADISQELTRAGWPAQAVIVRPASPTAGAVGGLTKGITDLDTLADAIAGASELSVDGLALIEPDLRAHHNPSRRDVLTHLGVSVAQRLATACPVCASPGWGKTRTYSGLACGQCGLPTEQPLADGWSCVGCAHEHTAPRPGPAADPRWCDRCNP